MLLFVNFAHFSKNANYASTFYFKLGKKKHLRTVMQQTSKWQTRLPYSQLETSIVHNSS